MSTSDHDVNATKQNNSTSIQPNPNMISEYFIYLLALLPAALASNASTSCSPGGTFDLTKFTLQLPSGSKGKPDSVSSSELSGCDGYHDKYFFSNKDDGSIVMKVPGSPDTSECVTTANSKHCRTELRESSPKSWSPKVAVNRLKASLVVVDSGGSTCIGQIHIDDSISVRPVAELYYKDSGEITMGVEQTRDGGNQKTSTVGNVPVGSKFSYEIRYENGSLSVQINDEDFKKMSTYELSDPDSYFKVGNYLQGSSASEVRFYSIDITHTGEEQSSSSSDAKREVSERSHSRDMSMPMF